MAPSGHVVTRINNLYLTILFFFKCIILYYNELKFDLDPNSHENNITRAMYEEVKGKLWGNIEF